MGPQFVRREVPKMVRPVEHGLNVLCGFHTLFPVRFRSELEEPLVVQIHRTSDVLFPKVRFIEVNSHSIIAPRGFGGLMDQAQRPPPGTRSGCNSRIEILPNCPTAQRGGDSLQQSC